MEEERKQRKKNGWTDEELICIDTGVGGGRVGRGKGAKDHSL